MKYELVGMIGAVCALAAVGANGEIRFVDLGGAWGIEGFIANNPPLPGAPYDGPYISVSEGGDTGKTRFTDDLTGEIVAIQTPGTPNYVSISSQSAWFMQKFGGGRRYRYLKKGTKYCAYAGQNWFNGWNGTWHTYQLVCTTLVPSPPKENCEMGPHVQIDMGSVAKSEFTGVGTGGREVEAAVPFTCSGPTDVNISVTGVVDPNRGGGLLKLTDGGAEGIGIQLRVNGGAVSVNGEGVAVAGVEGANVFQLSAQYVQTKEGVSAGAANASATVNVTVP